MAADTLNIVLVQPPVTWGDRAHNLAAIDRIIDSIPACDLVVLPEMFDSGFIMEKTDTATRRAQYDHALHMMLAWSERKQAAVCGSIAVSEDDRLYNRFLMVQHGAITATYNKRHLFGLMEENEYYTPGQQRVIAEVKGWRIQPLICYDLRFPAWCRNTDHADLQLYVANWPAKRAHHWKLLLPARAVENQCYVAGVNAVGTDNFGNAFSGDSAAYDFAGESLCALPPGQPGWTSATLSKNKLQAHREQYPFLPDRDIFTFE